MFRQMITRSATANAILILQVIPLLLLPASSFSLTTQEWWLPVVLTVLTAWAVFDLLVRRTKSNSPWLLFSFSQGFNIISRLMLLLPHATLNDNGVQVFNAPYVSLTLASILLSVFFLWYTELPEVRMQMARR